MKPFSLSVIVIQILWLAFSSNRLNAQVSLPSDGTAKYTIKSIDTLAIVQKGEHVYKTNCMMCHGANGQSDPIPPLANSDYLNSRDKKQLIRSLMLGLRDEIVVNGKKYHDSAMQAVTFLSDAELGAVLTYVYNNWGNNKTVVLPEDVTPIRAEIKQKKK